jgi:hypothetical protein
VGPWGTQHWVGRPTRYISRSAALCRNPRQWVTTGGWGIAAVPQHRDYWGTAALCPSHPSPIRIMKSARSEEELTASSARG